MGVKVMSRAEEFSNILRSLQVNETSDSVTYEEDVQILKMDGDKIPLVNMYCGNQMVFICQKNVPKIMDADDDVTNHASSDPNDDDDDEDGDDDDEDNTNDQTNNTSALKTEPAPQPLTVMKARQLLSLYKLAQNPNDSGTPAPPPLWVRCDMTDPAKTIWFGAESVGAGGKMSGVRLYSVTCEEATEDKKSFMTLDKLKQEHKKRHLSAPTGNKGNARFHLYGTTGGQGPGAGAHCSSVTVDFKWTHVERVLETPPLSSTATLNIKISSGDTRSPMFQMYREVEFLQTLADGLRTGETEWTEPLENTPALQLVKDYLEELQNTTRTVRDTDAKTQASETDTPIRTVVLERADLDFVEQLWVRMRKSVTSYRDISDCLKLVTDELRCGNIKPWIHRDSSSSLSRLILQSYHQQMEPVSLSGVRPLLMLLEMGLDKMRKDYINYLIREELATLNHLSFYLSTEVDVQEQVIRLRKLHHLLEILGTCSTFLTLPYDRLFHLTQFCLQHYKTSPYDEEHEFKLQIKPALISHLYQKEQPMLWGVEVSSGAGAREVRTSFQLSNAPLVQHVNFETDFPNETVNGDFEDPSFFSTLLCSSFVNFV